jgi:hypothetical protein
VTEPVVIAADPADPLLPYTHLVPLVELLIAHGNRVVKPGPRGEVFAPSQDGYTAYLADPVDWSWLCEVAVLPETIDYDAAHDELRDNRNWVSVLGSQA